MCEVMNNRLQKVFTIEEDFVQLEIDRRSTQMEEMLVNPELLKIKKELDVRTAIGPDGVDGCILRECQI